MTTTTTITSKILLVGYNMTGEQRVEKATTLREYGFYVTEKFAQEDILEKLVFDWLIVLWPLTGGLLPIEHLAYYTKLIEAEKRISFVCSTPPINILASIEVYPRWSNFLTRNFSTINLS